MNIMRIILDNGGATEGYLRQRLGRDVGDDIDALREAGAICAGFLTRGHLIVWVLR